MSTTQGMTLEAFITMLEVRLGVTYTDEQKEFARTFLEPMLSFSYPGTGKTSTALLGLKIAELHDKIPGQNIYALSFTRMATMELKHRHEDQCKALGIRNKINFKTLSALCRQILLENYKSLDFNDIKIEKTFSVKEMTEFIEDAAEENGVTINPYKIRAIIRAISSLNSSLVFDRVNVESKMVFKETELSYEDFQKLRKAAYDLNKIMECVQLDDIFLYTLELLKRNPQVSVELKKKIKVLLIDEFQDMSLLQLDLLRHMSDNVIAIGDIRQQIYAFNGACQEIAQKFREYFPQRREVSLTQSFRCGTKIANFATSLILPNKIGGEEFKGRPDLEGDVIITRELNLETLTQQIYDDFIENNNVFKKNVMFMFRNNFSAIPVAEELYKRQVPFRVNKYIPAHQVPVISDLCEIIEMVRNPKQASVVKALKYIMPEFSEFKMVTENPVYKAMIASGQSFMELKYSYKNKERAEDMMYALKQVEDMLLHNDPVKDIFNTIWPLYEDYIMKQERYLEQPASYYTALVAPLTQTKTYRQFTSDEMLKVEFIKENVERNRGLRCYTTHAAKGTEADEVYILDADESIFPNQNKLQKMLDKECLLDAAREVHNERCLVYVAATRAKEKLTIVHSGSLSSLFTEENKYEHLDYLYQTYKPDFNDVEVFEKFFRGETQEDFSIPTMSESYSFVD